MPVISMFYGIIVRMYSERVGKHHMPHVHAEYQGEEIVVDLNGNVIEGEMKPQKLRMLQVWMDIHHEELLANWTMMGNGEGYFKIDPLK